MWQGGPQNQAIAQGQLGDSSWPSTSGAHGDDEESHHLVEGDVNTGMSGVLLAEQANQDEMDVDVEGDQGDLGSPFHLENGASSQVLGGSRSRLERNGRRHGGESEWSPGRPGRSGRGHYGENSGWSIEGLFGRERGPGQP